MTTQELVCWNCGESLADIPRPISRHANCQACFEVLHCCRMCRHYLPDKRPYCDQDLADPPEVKENANFCEYFLPANRFDRHRTDKTNKAQSRLDSLFGDVDGVPEDDVSGTGSTLDDLFDE